MSCVRPAVEASAEAASVKPGSPCTICGEAVYAGGMWMAATCDLHICSRGCAQKLLLLALDTIYDLQAHDTEPGDLYAPWLRLAAETFEDCWMRAHERRSGSR